MIARPESAPSAAVAPSAFGDDGPTFREWNATAGAELMAAIRRANRVFAVMYVRVVDGGHWSRRSTLRPRWH